VRIECDSYPKEEIRCAQAGDWAYSKRLIEVKSIQMPDWRYELLVQVHELVEAALCKHRGITDEAVTAFDAQFEIEREAGLHTPEAEDGDDPRAPYRKEHFTATNIERQLAAELDVDWALYEKCIQSQYAETGKSV
jgi:hypothetical protein